MPYADANNRKTTLGWQLKAKVYTDGIKVIL